MPNPNASDRKLPEIDEVRHELISEWRVQRRLEIAIQRYESLRENYDVVIEQAPSLGADPEASR